MISIVRKILAPRPIYAKLGLASIVTIILIATLLGYLEPIKTFLQAENLSFKFGETKLSPYTILKAIVTLIILLWSTEIIADAAKERIQKIKKINQSNKTLITKTIQGLIYTIGLLIILNILGINITALAVFGGAIGIGLGFAIQKIAANFISGFILLIEKSIKAGDLIELPDGIAGTVKQIKARYALIETFNGREMMIPNEDFITSRVINWTFSNKKARIDISISVSYKSNIKRAQELIIQAAQEHPRSSKDRSPECYLRAFNDNAIQFLLIFWVDNINDGRFKPQSDVMFEIWQKFKENDIEIPFPQHDIYIKEQPTRKYD